MLTFCHGSGSPDAWRVKLAFAKLIGPQYGVWMAHIEALPYTDACIPPDWKAAA